MRSFMAAEIDEYYMEALTRYYIASGDKESKVVDFSSGLVSPYLNGSEDIGEDFTIIDSFNGAAPIVFTHRVLVENKGEGEIPFVSGIVLDSQVVSYLHQLLSDESGAYKVTSKGIATEKLLRRLAQYSQRGWDVNPFFYLLESMSKGVFETVFPYAHSFTESMLRVQSMDYEHFLQHGRIVPNPEKLDEYTRRHGSAPFQAVSANLVGNMADCRSNHELQSDIQIIYATLLKVGLLAQEKSSLECKIMRLMDFFKHDLGVFLMRVAILACRRQPL